MLDEMSARYKDVVVEPPPKPLPKVLAGWQRQTQITEAVAQVLIIDREEMIDDGNRVAVFTGTLRLDPDDAYAVLMIDPQESFTMSSDMTISCTMDDGSNYEEITMESAAFLTIGDTEYWRGDVSGLTARTDKTMRLKIENQRITEAEAIIVETMMGGGMGGGAMTVPPAAYSETLAPEDRVSREELIKISSLYFDSIEQCNGKIVPWHDECYRLENGMWTAGPGLPPELAVHMQEPKAPTPAPGGETSPAFARGPCTEAIDSGVFALIESIQPRRIPVVDEERGVTWGVYMFNHPGVETITMPDGTTQPAAYFRGQPNSMPMSELFKIKGGEIRDIMAIGIIKEYGSDSGWK